jgi:hypothetical protein
VERAFLPAAFDFAFDLDLDLASKISQAARSKIGKNHVGADAFIRPSKLRISQTLQ